MPELLYRRENVRKIVFFMYNILQVSYWPGHPDSTAGSVKSSVVHSIKCLQ